MSNPSIASKLMSMVKGIFGQKEAEDATTQGGRQSASAEQKAEAGSAESATAAAATGTKTAPDSEKEQEQEPAPAVEDSVKAVEEDDAAKKSAKKADKAEKAAEPAAAEDSVKAVEEDDAADKAEKTADRADLVGAEDRGTVADELAAAEATTQESDDSVLEDVRRQAAPAADELAVPGYDDLTLPSIRARLRKLTIAQVRDLRAYEVAHGERPEFIKMYDNRIAKLESEES